MQSKYISLTLAICTIGFISACKEENRDNPVLSKDTITVSNWLLQTYGEKIEICGIHWADPKEASKDDLNYCKETAKKVADEMNYQGFLQDVRPKDLNVPLIWRNFTKRLKSERARLKKAKEGDAEMKRLLGVK